MKIKHIIGAILMVLLTVLGIVLSYGVSVTKVLSSNGIMKSMIDTDYLTRSEEAAKNVLLNYMDQEKAEEILNNVSVKSGIREIAAAFDNNTINEATEKVKETLKEQVIASLDKDIEVNTKESFAMLVSDAYIKAIFPVKPSVTTTLTLPSNISLPSILP